MAKLNAKKRGDLSKGSFALPAKRAYPINDESHARAALSMLHNASPEDQATIKRAIKRKYPNIEQGSGTLTALGQRTLAGFQQKYGTTDGHARFEKAIASGVLSKDKMEES